MQLRTTTEPATVARWCVEAAEHDPVPNNVFAIIADAARWQDEPGAWAAQCGTALAARSSAATAVVVTEGWTDAGELAAVLRGIHDVAGLEGPVDLVNDLVAALPWSAQRMAERLYRCDELRPPSDIAGAARLATVADLDLLAGWHLDFVREALGAVPAHFDPHRQVERGLQTARSWIWQDGAPCSSAIGRAPVCGVARVGRVYTPPRYRGRGYGTAVTAAVAQDILDAGAVPILYTDQANPTSNKIYQAIGFRPVADRLAVSFR